MGNIMAVEHCIVIVVVGICLYVYCWKRSDGSESGPSCSSITLFFLSNKPNTFSHVFFLSGMNENPEHGNGRREIKKKYFFFSRGGNLSQVSEKKSHLTFKNLRLALKKQKKTKMAFGLSDLWNVCFNLAVVTFGVLNIVFVYTTAAVPARVKHYGLISGIILTAFGLLSVVMWIKAKWEGKA